MATKTAILAVKIVSDAKDFTSKMDTSISKLDQFQNAAKKLAVPAAAVLTGLGAIALGTGKMASDAQQNFGAVDAVFKDHAGRVKEMAKTSAQNLGLSGSDYAKYSALLGSQLKNAGVPMDKLASHTDKLIGYGADFAAQFGGTVPEAVEALSSALKGEMDPIEKYGISLNENKIKAQMAADGTDKLTGAAYDQAKAQAIMNLIQKQGTDAMGAFGREAGTAAGQQAIATAKWQDASAALGSVLLPIMTQAATVLADVAKWVMENQGLVTGLAVGLGILAAAVLILNGAMIAMNIIAALNPWVILGVAVLALVAGIIYLATQTRFFQDVWAAVCLFVGDRINEIVGFMNTLGAGAQTTADGVRGFFIDSWNTITGWISGKVNEVIGFFTNLGANAQNHANNVRQGFVDAFNNVRNTAQNIINGIVNFFSDLGNKAQNIADTVRNGIGNAFNHIQGVASGVIDNIVGFFGRIGGAVQGAIDWVGRLFNMGGMPGWLSSVLGMGGTGFNVTTFNALPGELGMGATGGYSSGGFSGSSSTLFDLRAKNSVLTVEVRADTSHAERSIRRLEGTRLNIHADVTPRVGYRLAN